MCAQRVHVYVCGVHVCECVWGCMCVSVWGVHVCKCVGVHVCGGVHVRVWRVHVCGGVHVCMRMCVCMPYSLIVFFILFYDRRMLMDVFH